MEHTAAVSSSIGGIPALFERLPDTLDHKVIDFASTRAESFFGPAAAFRSFA